MTDNNSIQDKLNTDNQSESTKNIPAENISDSPDNTISESNNNISNISDKPKSKRGNINNLKPVLTKEEARERGRRGGLKSGEVRRNRKTMKDTILELIQKEVSTEKYGGDSSILGDKATLQEIILASMIREASNGDTKAMQLLRDTIGEQPVNRQEITQEVITKDDTELMDSLKKSLIS